MRVAAAVLGLLSAACAAPREAPPWAASIDVPEVRTVGAIPPPPRATIEIERDGRRRVDGTGVASDAELSAALAAGAEPPTVLIACDGAAPWREAVRALLACSDPKVEALSVFFAARSAAGPGAIATFLPAPCLCAGHGVDVRFETVHVVREDGSSDPERLAAWLTAHRGVGVQVDAAPDAPVAVVLRTVDAAARGGAAALTFVSVRPNEPAAPSWPGARWGIRIDGADLPPAAAGAASDPAPRVDGPWGFAESLARIEERKPAAADDVPSGPR